MDHGKVLGMQNLRSETVLPIGGPLIGSDRGGFPLSGKSLLGWGQNQQWWYCAAMMWAESREGCSSSGW